MIVTNILKILFLFCYGSFFGYIFELFFRRYVSQKKWVNPGFLTGPYLPIYGFGVIIMYIITTITKSLIGDKLWGDVTAIILIGFFMTLIEYIGGIIFIKGMKIRLWDYSDRWGNIDGLICPLFSLIWTVFGALYYFFMYPYMLGLTEWLVNNLAFSFVIGMIIGFMIIDAWNTMKISTKIREYAKEKNIVVKYENLKININKRKAEFKQKITMFTPLRFIEGFQKELDSYKENEEHKSSEK